MDNKPELHDLLTPQEHYLMGGTPPMELVKDATDFYKPFGLLTKALTPDAVTNARKERKSFSGLPIQIILKDTSLELSLEDLDPESLTTLKDPKVVEVQLDDAPKIRDELTKSFYKTFRNMSETNGSTFDARLRDPEITSNPEKKG